MEVKNSIKLEIVKQGYKSVRSFAREHNIRYEALHYLISGQATSISYELLINTCEALNCEVGELFYIEKEVI